MQSIEPSEMVQKSVRVLKIHGGVGRASCKMEDRFESWRKSARLFYNSRTSRQTAVLVAAIFVVFQAFTLVSYGGGDGGSGGGDAPSGHSSLASANQVNGLR